ncbi:ABC transporter substrate-binding protein [Rathayibacter sp. VKM Ac-2927]|uniref:ABC transporter substrate-binding protein n=1 Tax=Rathayibacter sp. VKM Ac-2927 TaxID=2929478 RepID=UPI001FB4AF56|nr:ABC transporter substrate-binding protein [Rathayibacter sp. VKM Ac-2927]MCJ1688328.1 ABC transporter substrate-binding protein [Rathayibacter sp. VKM Ac-2927]
MGVALAAAVALSGCSGTAGAEASPDGLIPVTFALSYLPDTSLNGLTYAQEHGLFADQGLDVEILPWGSSTPESLVAAGQADFGFATDIRTALLAMASGADVTSLMAVYQHVPYELTVLADAGYTSPADLAGKTYGGFGSPMEIAVVDDMIAAAGGTAPAENVVLSVAAFDALSSERVDTVLSFPGDIYAMEQSGSPITTWKSTDFGLPDGYASLVLTNNTFEAENPEVVSGFMSAFQAGYQAALADPAAADTTVMKTYPDDLSADVVQFVSDIQTKSLYVSADGIVGSQSAEIWQQNADWLASKGLLVDESGTTLDAFDTADLFTNNYLAQ